MPTLFLRSCFVGITGDEQYDRCHAAIVTHVPTEILLQDVRLVDDRNLSGSSYDVVVRGGRVAAIVQRGEAHPFAGSQKVDLAGRYLLPGLWDNHVHFTLWSEIQERVDVSSCASAKEVASLVRKRVESEWPEPDRVLVGYGFRDGLWPDHPDRSLLDASAPTTPVALLSGDLHCVWLNSAAMHRFGLGDSYPSGVLREEECLPVLEGIKSSSDNDAAAERAASAAASRGIVGIMDFERADNISTWSRRIAGGNRNLRVECVLWEEHLDAAIAAGYFTGAPVPDTGGLATVGPFKVLVDGSLNTRTALCFDAYPTGDGGHGLLTVQPKRLVELMSKAWQHGISSAVHAIGDRANTVALDAFEEVGAFGSIEHAQLLTHDDVSRFARLGVTASVQPSHVVDDRDVAEMHWAGRVDRAFVFADLLAAGAQLAFGSDAPVSVADPWTTIAAAVRRTDDERPPWFPQQRISLRDALLSSTRGRDRVRVGDIADMVVTDLDPFELREDELATMPVHATLLGGRWTLPPA